MNSPGSSKDHPYEFSDESSVDEKASIRNDESSDDDAEGKETAAVDVGHQQKSNDANKEETRLASILHRCSSPVGSILEASGATPPLDEDRSLASDEFDGDIERDTDKDEDPESQAVNQTV
jgi:hypothetical protein